MTDGPRLYSLWLSPPRTPAPTRLAPSHRIIGRAISTLVRHPRTARRRRPL